MTRRMSITAGIFLTIGTLAIFIWLIRINEAHRARYGDAFPQLQDARQADVAQGILTRWDHSGANTDIRKAMRIDLGFPFFYATLLALLCICASRSRPTRWVARLGQWCALIALIAGAADLSENITMLGMVGHPELASRLSTMITFTQIKNGGAYAALLYLLLSHLDTQRGVAA